MIYTIYHNQISLFYQDSPYSIPIEDFRFEIIKIHLLEGAFDKVEKLINYENYFTIESGIEYRDNVLYYKGEQLPGTLSDLILQAKIRTKDYSHYINLFIALKYNKDFTANPHKRKLFYKKFKDIFVLGDYVIYDSQEKLPIKNFYDFSELPPYFQAEILSTENIPDAIQNIAGFKSDKLIKVFKEEVFQEIINTYFIDFLALCKGIIDPNAMYPLWEEIKNKFDISYPQSLNVFLAEYKKSQKSIINFLKDSEKNYLHRLDSLVFQNQELNILLPETSSAQELIPIYQREISRSKGSLFFLHLEDHFPIIKNLDRKIGDLEIIIPQHNEELNEWSRLMSNCISTYAQRAKKGECLLLGIKSEDKMLYNIEITTRGTISQFLSKCNHNANENDRKNIEDVLRKNHILK